MRKHGNSRGKGTNCANGNLEIGGAEATLVARHVYPRGLAHYSCAPASYRHGRDGACTRLLLYGPEGRL